MRIGTFVYSSQSLHLKCVIALESMCRTLATASWGTTLQRQYYPSRTCRLRSTGHSQLRLTVASVPNIIGSRNGIPRITPGSWGD